MQRFKGRTQLWIVRAAAVLLIACSQSPAQAAGTTSELPIPAQAAISAALGRDDDAYHALPDGQGLRLSNPRHGLAVLFTSEGIQIERGSARWGFSWQGYGYGTPSLPGPAVVPTSDTNRVEYRRGPVTEWYVNGPRGLQQGFTLSVPPTRSTDGPLTVALGLWARSRRAWPAPASAWRGPTGTLCSPIEG